jgi:hypothetical protein
MPRIERSVKKILKDTVRRARRYVQSLDEENGTRDYSKDDFAYPWLNSIFQSILRLEHAAKKPSYAWGVVHAAHLASNLKVPTISVIEFGVAGGNGLLALESIAKETAEIFGVGIDAYGFDIRKGLPKPCDYRDMPNLYLEAAFRMDVAKLKNRLRTARLHLGLVQDTVADFIRSAPAPIGFVSFDMDYYSSTMQAFQAFDADTKHLLPRVHCYFDDIMGFTYSDINGERLAIAEFNRNHETRKISPIYGLKHFLPARQAGAEWVEEMFIAHILDHPLYGHFDGLVRRPFRSGTDLRVHKRPAPP